MTDKPRRNSAAKAPVSAHPAFPAIVALWFAALLGIGTLVLPVVLLERLTEASGLSSLVVAAQAPLGMTARIAIAFAAAVIGGLVGLAIAARIAASHASGSASTAQSETPPVEEAAVKRPISALEELGPDGIDAEVSIARIDAHSWMDDPERPRAFADRAPSDDHDPAQFSHRDDIEMGWNTSPESEIEEPWAERPVETQTWSEPASEDQVYDVGPSANVDQSTDAIADGAREPSIVELVERFAKALQQHRETARQQPVSAPLSAPASIEDGAFDEIDTPAREGYSSLLAMTGSLQSQRDTARSANSAEPVVPFPSQRPDRAQTEGALRQALEKLQKLSGVA